MSRFGKLIFSIAALLVIAAASCYGAGRYHYSCRC